MATKEIIGVVAAALTVIGGAIYLWQIYARTVKPHAFSWIVWGTLALVSFAAQLAGGAGPGAWAMGVSALNCYVFAVFGLFYGEKNITRSDWVAFVAALLAIPVWRATHNPLWAVVIVSCIDAVAFYPTFRKSWLRPYEEGAAVFSLITLQMLLSILAAQKYSLTVILYPAVIIFLNLTLIAALLYRRRSIPA